MTYKVLIVDDQKANLRMLERLLREDYYCLTASNGEEAIELLCQHEVAILITDQRMPQMSGIELLKRTAVLRPHMARILLTGYTDTAALVEAINCGLVHRYVTKPWNNEDLKLKVSRALEEYENNRTNHALKVANERLQMRLKEMKRGIANAFAALLRSTDEYSGEHAARVAAQVSKIAERMGIGEDDREDVTLAAALHSLGHVGTPHELLARAGTQTSSERAIYQGHSERGARILAIIPDLGNVADLVLFHHENFDGSGSPRGLEGEQIPLACRIIRAADEYDLLTQARTPSASLNHQDAMRFMESRAGIEFDPAIVKIMSQLEVSELKALASPGTLVEEWMVDAPADVQADNAYSPFC